MVLSLSSSIPQEHILSYVHQANIFATDRKMVKPKCIKKEVRKSSSKENDQTTPNVNKVKQSRSNPPSTISRQSRSLNSKVFRTEPDLVDCVQYDTEWKNPYKCVACGGRFGWRLERDSHELVCLDQINGQELLQMETQNNNLQRENKRRNKLELDRVVEIDDIGHGLSQKEKYDGSLQYVNDVDANDNYEVRKCIKNDMELKLETVTNKINLSDLPSELLISFIFPKLNPSDLARLLHVNIRLNQLVNSYLGNLTCLELKALQGKDDPSSCRKNCFKFMSKMTTKLVRVNVGVKKYRGCFVNGHSCFNNQDLILSSRKIPT